MYRIKVSATNQSSKKKNKIKKSTTGLQTLTDL